MRSELNTALLQAVVKLIYHLEQKGYKIPSDVDAAIKAVRGRDPLGRKRDELEKELARRVGSIQRAQIGRILELMGDPPDISRIPAAYWDEIGEELTRAILPVLHDAYMDTARGVLAGVPTGLDWALVNRGAVAWSQRYTFDLVRGLSDTTRTGLQQALSSYYSGGLTRGDLERLIEPYFGAERSESIAVTEVTRASAQSEEAIAEELRQAGIEMVEVWQTNYDDLVCDECGPRNDKRKGDGWTDPPPAHPRCRCWINLELPDG